MPLADRALVVGINHYPGISALSGAENDAQDFYDWVTNPVGGGVDRANALLILSSNYPVLANVDYALPGKREIELFFTGVRNSAVANNAARLGNKSGKRLWMFFSGHGFAPSLDQSGVLMANATLDMVHNIAARWWADRLYEGGWFDDVLLFQDACRSRIGDADLTPPFLKRQAPRTQKRRRFYAFAAKERELAKELTFNGRVRGVFTVTLMAGLRSGARGEGGAITTTRLAEYLHKNMSARLPVADLNNPEIAKSPGVLDPSPFEILEAPPVPQVPKFPVHIAMRQPGLDARVLDGNLQPIAYINPAPEVWALDLPVGLYKVLAGGVAEVMFEVTGALTANGSPQMQVVNA